MERALRRRWRELAVPIASVCAALVLVGAALLPSNDPSLAARVAFEQLCEQLEQGLVEAWNAHLRRAEPPFEPDLAAPSAPYPQGTERGDNGPLAAAGAPSAASILLEELERGLLAGVATSELEPLANSALAAASEPRDKACALHAQVSLALRADDLSRARDALRDLFAAAGGAEARSDVSVLLLAWLEAAGRGVDLDPTWATQLAERADQGTLALPLGSIAIRSEDSLPRWSGTERATALRERALLAPGGGPLAAAIERAARARQRAVFEREFGPRATEAGSGTRWTLRAVGALQLAEPAAVEAGAVVARSARLVDAFRALAPRLPDGFAWNIGVAPDLPLARDERAVALASAPFGCRLRTPDADAVVEGAVRRVLLLKSALLVLAALCLLGGWATWRAMVRERRLAELRALFVANVSHELRTPLASILLLAENLADGRVRSADQAARYHTGIQREALRLRELVDSVLDLSRLERGKPLAVERSDVPLDAWWAATAAELVERALSRAATLEIATGELGGSAQLDGNALRRALLNLVENALRHSGDTHLVADAGIVDGELVLGVRDHGRGIPAAERERVFEPFERLDGGTDAAPGTGLGLSIVRAIAVAHGGCARCVPVEPGARFELAIPLQPSEVSRA